MLHDIAITVKVTPYRDWINLLHLKMVESPEFAVVKTRWTHLNVTENAAWVKALQILGKIRMRNFPKEVYNLDAVRWWTLNGIFSPQPEASYAV